MSEIGEYIKSNYDHCIETCPKVWYYRLCKDTMTLLEEEGYLMLPDKLFLLIASKRRGRIYIPKERILKKSTVHGYKSYFCSVLEGDLYSLGVWFNEPNKELALKKFRENLLDENYVLRQKVKSNQKMMDIVEKELRDISNGSK